MNASAPRLADSLTWLREVIWERPALSGLVQVRLDEVRPRGYRPVASYAVVPDLRHARFLVPLASPAAARASLLAYNRLRTPLVRASRRLLATGYFGPLRGIAPGDRLHVYVRSDAPTDEQRAATLEWTFADLFGRPVAAAIGLRPVTPNRKPVAQLFDLSGSPLGYAKLGWNSYTSSLVTAEAAALRSLEVDPHEGVHVPSLLWNGAWQGVAVVISSPLPTGVRPQRTTTSERLWSFTRVVAGAGPLEVRPLGASAYWSRLSAALTGALAVDTTGAVRAHLAFLAGRSDVSFCFGRWHGDWVPWNMGWVGDELWVWDWEHSAPDAPLGFDVVHESFQRAFVVQRRGVRDAAAAARRASLPQLRLLGLSAVQADTVFALYLAELFTRYRRAAQGGSGDSVRFSAEILDVLASVGGTAPGRSDERVKTS